MTFDELRRDRLFHARMSMGLFDDPSTIAYSTLGEDDIFSGPHKQAALKMSEKSLVLLKNEQILPVSPAKVKSVAVIVWGANDSYAPLANVSRLQPESTTTP